MDQFLSNMDVELLGELPMMTEISSLSENVMPITNEEVQNVLEKTTQKIINA